MKIVPGFILVLSIMAVGCNRDDVRRFIPLAPSPKDIASSISGNETAKVERVFFVQDGEFSCISYQVTWHGQQVIVNDPIHSTDLKVGDTIVFMVMKHDMSSKQEPTGQKLLNFQVFPL